MSLPMPSNTRGRSRSRLRRRSGRRQLLRGLAFTSPWLVGFFVLIAGPVIASAWYSFTDFNLFQSPHFVGLTNYRQMMHDTVFWKGLTNTLYLTVVGVPIGLAISLTGAIILNMPVRGQPLYRALVYLPTIVPVVVSGYLWRWLLNPQYGYLNELLRLLHLPQPLWLDNPAWGKPAILLTTFWTVGGMTVIYLAALKDVPRDLYEAAAMDGAGPWARFWNVTWPVISPVTLFQVIVSTIAYLQIFAQPYLLTQNSQLNAANGGPQNSMLSYSMYLFQNAFVFLKMGYASAMAWVLFIITMGITAVLLLNARRWVHYGNR